MNRSAIECARPRISAGAAWRGVAVDRLRRAATLRRFRAKMPTEEIEARLRPTRSPTCETCRASGHQLQAADMLKTSCQPDDAVTPSARLAAVSKRLETICRRSSRCVRHLSISTQHSATSRGPVRAIVRGEQPQVNLTPQAWPRPELFRKLIHRMGGSRTTDEVLSHHNYHNVFYGSSRHSDRGPATSSLPL